MAQEGGSLGRKRHAVFPQAKPMLVAVRPRFSRELCTGPFVKTGSLKNKEYPSSHHFLILSVLPLGKTSYSVDLIRGSVGERLMGPFRMVVMDED